MRWTIMSLAAIAGYALGHIAGSAIEGAITFLSFLPFVGVVLCLGGIFTTNLSAIWSTNFAMCCAPSHQMNVRWSVLIMILLFGMLELAAVVAAQPKQRGVLSLYFVEGAGVIGWLFWETWHVQMAKWWEK